MIPHIVGGDDLVVSVVADRAWRFTVSYLDAFRAHARDIPGVGDEHGPALPSASAGLVFAHMKFPFRRAAELAADRLRAAKRQFHGVSPAVAWLDVTRDGEQPPAALRAWALDDLLALEDALGALRTQVEPSGRAVLERLVDTGQPAVSLARLARARPAAGPRRGRRAVPGRTGSRPRDRTDGGRAVGGQVVAVRFEIVFHTPFRVSSGHAGDGSDTTVDRAALLPASSLKGVMLSAARDLLKFPRSQVEAVFGTAWHESPWGWSDAVMTEGGQHPAAHPDPDRAGHRHRRQGRAAGRRRGPRRPAPSSASTRIGWVEAGQEGTHETILLAAARSVTAVGGDRRRGSGWVTVTPVEPQWSGAHLRAAAALAGTADPATATSRTPGVTGDRPREPAGDRHRPAAPGARRRLRGVLLHRHAPVRAGQRAARGAGRRVDRRARAAHGRPATRHAFRALFDGPVRYGPMYVPGTVVVAGLGAAVQVSPRRELRVAGGRCGLRDRAAAARPASGRWSRARDRSSCPAMSPWSGSPAPRSTRRQPRPPTANCTRTARSRPGRS